MLAVAPRPIETPSAVRLIVTSRANSAGILAAPLASLTPSSNNGLISTKPTSKLQARKLTRKRNRGSRLESRGKAFIGSPGVQLESLGRPKAPRPKFGAITGGALKIFFDAQQLVVLGDSIGAAKRARFDLAAIGG